MRVPLRFLLVAGVVTALLILGGVLVLGGDDGAAPREPEPYVAATLADHDASTAAITRGPFCAALDDRLVDAVLGQVPEPQTWENGDQVDVGTGTPDVVHEFGCAYAAPDGGTARAWVFAPPVAADRAAQLAKAASRSKGCTAGTGPAFGTPTLALTCTDPDGSVRASYRGLFGDAWLVCEVAEPPGSQQDAVDLAGRWCVGVLEAASTPADATG